MTILLEICHSVEGIIQTSQKESSRRIAYSCDVTYVSNQELGFDFLRDNLAMSLENIVQQKAFNFCVVDEADSILIDEARTPLIISRKVGCCSSWFLRLPSLKLLMCR